jgi:four helix bundle protein
MVQRGKGKEQRAKGIGHGVKGREQRASVKHRVKFRFEDLEIWKLSVEIAEELFEIADDLVKKRFHRFAEQLRGAGISMPNNIAEGAGSTSKKEFIQFLNFARRSIFENANMIIIFSRKHLIDNDRSNSILQKLDILSRKITVFKKTLTQSAT